MPSRIKRRGNRRSSEKVVLALSPVNVPPTHFALLAIGANAQAVGPDVDGVSPTDKPLMKLVNYTTVMALSAANFCQEALVKRKGISRATAPQNSPTIKKADLRAAQIGFVGLSYNPISVSERVAVSLDGLRLLHQLGHNPALGFRDRTAFSDLNHIAVFVLIVFVMSVVLA